MAVANHTEPPSPLTLAAYLRTAIIHFTAAYPSCTPHQVLQATRILETYYRAAHVGGGKAKAHRYHTEQHEDTPDTDEE